MSAEIIPFDEAATRVRERRERASSSDLATMAVICCWPIALSLFAGIAAFEAALEAWGRRS